MINPAAAVSSTPFGAGAAWTSVAGIFAVDCFTQMNLSILYALPLIAIGRTLSTAKLAALTALLVAATFVAYTIKTTLVLQHAPPLVSYRLLNRSLVASILVLSAIVLRALYRGVGGEHRERDDFDRLLASLTPILVTLLGAVAAAAILVADLITPGEYNLPILYGLPIVLIAAAGSERLMWIAVLVFAVLSLIGFWAGPAPQVAPGLLHWAVVNRSLAVFAVIGLAILLRSARRAAPPADVEPTNPPPR